MFDREIAKKFEKFPFCCKWDSVFLYSFSNIYGCELNPFPFQAFSPFWKLGSDVIKGPLHFLVSCF